MNIPAPKLIYPSKRNLLFAMATIILVAIIVALSIIASGIGSLSGICNPECL